MIEHIGGVAGQMTLVLGVAMLLGLFAGWLIFGGAKIVRDDSARAENDALRLELEAAERARAALERKVERLRAAPRTVDMAATVGGGRAEGGFRFGAQPVRTGYRFGARSDSVDPPIRPNGLHAPRDPGPDDFRKIRGIGEKAKARLHDLGIFHFDQIAAWSPQETAWIDANLGGFKGVASRHDWVAQAGALVGAVDARSRSDPG